MRERKVLTRMARGSRLYEYKEKPLIPRLATLSRNDKAFLRVSDSATRRVILSGASDEESNGRAHVRFDCNSLDASRSTRLRLAQGRLLPLVAQKDALVLAGVRQQ